MRFLNYDQKKAILTQMVVIFSLEEIELLCFELHILYEELKGTTRSEKLWQICSYADSQDQVEKLIKYCVLVRPNVDWWGIWKRYEPKSLPLPTHTASPNPLTPLTNEAAARQVAGAIFMVQIPICAITGLIGFYLLLANITPAVNTALTVIGLSPLSNNSTFTQVQAIDSIHGFLAITGCYLNFNGSLSLLKLKRRGWQQSIIGMGIILISLMSWAVIRVRPVEVCLVLPIIGILAMLYFARIKDQLV